MYNQAVGQFTFDQQKALEIILYISRKCQDQYHLLKILYYADREHLQEYGRFTCGDSYIAFKFGPVPKEVFDMIDHVRSKGTDGNNEYNYLINEFKAENQKIIPLREPDINVLSPSDVECLDKSIEVNKDLSIEDLRIKSHDKAYDSADQNSYISVETIAGTLRDGESIIGYLRNMYV